MTEKEKIREYLVGMANAACCNKQTAKDIKEIIIPYIDSMQKEPKECMYSKDNYTSEDYEKALNSVAVTFLQEQQIVPNFYGDMIIKAVKHGANWQKQNEQP